MINLTTDKANTDNNQITKVFVLKACFHENRKLNQRKNVLYSCKQNMC